MKTIFSLLLTLALGAPGFAAEDTAMSPLVPVNTRHSFEKTFASVKEVHWTSNRNLYTADFVFNGQYVAAHYDIDGNLIGLTKNILSSQLPLFLENSLKEEYAGYWIADLIEFSSEEGTRYYATLENGEGKMIIKSSVANWVVTKKIKK